MAVVLGAKICFPCVSKTMQTPMKHNCGYKPQSRCCYAVQQSPEVPSSRRCVLFCTGTSLVAVLAFNASTKPLPAWAEDNARSKEEDDEGVIGSIKSLLNPNEETKSGKVLPKAYLKSARDVVKTLRESLKEDPKDNAKFRRTADAAKESIRDYLSNWRGQQTIVHEESYMEIEKAIRSLAGFYSKAGPSAPLPEEQWWSEVAKVWIGSNAD